MKFGIVHYALGKTLGALIKDEVPGRANRRVIYREYREIFKNAPDIGAKNRLMMSYALAAYFIAMNRHDGLSADENGDILYNALHGSKIYKTLMGTADEYFSEKNMISRRKWMKETHDEKHRQQYPNDWVVDVLEKKDDYEFGFDYHECGVVKLCRDEGCPELAKYLCRLDFMTAELMGLGLRRTKTLAEGGDCCDFRWLKK